MAKKSYTLDQTMDRIAAKYSLSMIRNMGHQENERPLEVIPTGILRLDAALGAGGLPRRRGSEIWGPDKAGKTTLASTVMANLSVTPQPDGREGGVSVLIDEEDKLDSDYFEQCIVNSGGDLTRCWHIQPEAGDAGFEAAFNLIGKVDAIFYDTVAAYTPSAIQDMSEIDGATWAIESRILSIYLKRINKQLARTWKDESLSVGTAFILVNQARVEMSEYRAKYREGLKPWGGKLLKHFRSTQIFLRPYGYGLGKSIFNPDGDDIGVLSRLMVEKNVVGKPHQAIDKPAALIRFGTGFCPSDDAFKAGLDWKVIRREGNTYFWHGNNLGVGEARTVQILHENTEVRNEIRAEIGQLIQERAKLVLRGETKGEVGDVIIIDDPGAIDGQVIERLA